MDFTFGGRVNWEFRQRSWKFFSDRSKLDERLQAALLAGMQDVSELPNDLRERVFTLAHLLTGTTRITFKFDGQERSGLTGFKTWWDAWKTNPADLKQMLWAALETIPERLIGMWLQAFDEDSELVSPEPSHAPLDMLSPEQKQAAADPASPLARPAKISAG